MSISRWSLGVAVLAALTAMSGRLSAQMTTGNIGGRVTGASGEGIPQAQIQVTNGATGVTVGTMTRSDGNYLMAGLEVGNQYRVTVRRIGFQPQTIGPVRVILGQTTPVAFVLTNAAAQLAAVTIEGARTDALIAPTQKGSQTTITDTLLRKLPTLNRTFTDFVALTPQVSTTGPGVSGGGVDNRYNNIQIDGATERDMFGLGSTGQPGGQANGKSIGLESVKEYQVLLAPYDVRVGDFAGLSINAVTKSGTNQLTGEAYSFYRNQNFQRTEPYLGTFNQNEYGFALGGPIMKNKVFFFVNPEFQARSVPAAGPALGDASTKVTSGLVSQFTSALSANGMSNLGDASRVNNQNPLANVFARLDFALPWNSTLVLRDNYAHAEQQVFSRGATGATPSFPLTSNLYQFTSDKQAPVAQLRTNFSNGSYNEAIVGYTRIRDKRATPGTLEPQVTVNINGTAALVAGTEQSSQANQLDQDIIELTDNYTIPIGSSNRFTIGTQNQWYKVRNLFGQSLVGAWFFGSMDSLTAGLPDKYQVGVPVTGDGAVRFRAGQYSGYAEDEWTATPNLNMTFGLRFDDPIFFNKPPENQTVLSQFGINTSQVPSGNIQWSPRFGFNWNATGDGKNQVRGGVGAFQGAPAYVWMSNEFQNSGGVSGFASLTCSNAATSPAFNATNVAHAPQACSNGTTAAAGSEVDYANQNLKFPQTIRGNLAYDRDLGDGFVFTGEAMYTRFLNSLFYTNDALQDQPIGTALDGRALYGTALSTPSLKVASRNAVFVMQNESKDYSYSYTAQIQKRFTRNFGGSLAYTYTQSYDIQDLTSSTATSQWRFGRPYAGSQDDISLGHSAWETPNRVIGDVSYTLPSKTSLSLIYTGQSGLNFTYTSTQDLNGDGQTSNDPIYIPKGPTDPKGPVFVTSGSVTATPAQQAAAFNNFISSNACLNSQRGTIMTRNTCQSPWTNEFDVAVEQALTTIRGQNLSLRLDVINIGNLLNKNWGQQITTSNFSPVAIYTQSGMVLPGTTTTAGANLANGVPRVTFDPNFNPFTYQNVYSVYGMQLSLRYSF